MKRTIITLAAVAAAIVAAHMLNRQPPEPTVPYYNYN